MSENEKKDGRGKLARAHILIWVVYFVLIAVGMLSVSSALINLPSSSYRLLMEKQVLFYILGILTAIALSKVKLEELIKSIPLITLLTIMLLLLPFTPLGISVNGSRAWVRLGPFSFQPSELVKLVIVLYTAYFTTYKERFLKDYRKGFLPPLIILGTMAVLIEMEPDLGNLMIITAIFLATMYAGGSKLTHLAGLLTLFSLAFAGLIAVKPYRVKRILTFLNPWSDPYGSGYNVIQSLIAHGRGGIWGVGLGMSIQKLFYLPEHHTDFIFSLIGEELGLVGSLGVGLLYLALFLLGLKVTLSTEDKIRKMIAFGISFAIAIQALINMGMTVSMFPVTGITLPLISYGGSSVIVTSAMIGLLANLAKESQKDGL